MGLFAGAANTRPEWHLRGSTRITRFVLFIWHLKLACYVGSRESVATYLYGLLRSNLDWSVTARVRAATDDGGGGSNRSTVSGPDQSRSVPVGFHFLSQL